jgi:hypothetical protein
MSIGCPRREVRDTSRVTLPIRVCESAITVGGSLVTPQWGNIQRCGSISSCFSTVTAILSMDNPLLGQRVSSIETLFKQHLLIIEPLLIYSNGQCYSYMLFLSPLAWHSLGACCPHLALQRHPKHTGLNRNSCSRRMEGEYLLPPHVCAHKPREISRPHQSSICITGAHGSHCASRLARLLVTRAWRTPLTAEVQAVVRRPMAQGLAARVRALVALASQTKVLWTTPHPPRSRCEHLCVTTRPAAPAAKLEALYRQP